MELVTIDAGMSPGRAGECGPAPQTGLETLLGGLPREAFVQSCWDIAPVHIRRRDAAFYAATLSLVDARGIADNAVSMASAVTGLPLAETFFAEMSPERERPRSPRELWQAHDRGATVLVQMAQRFHPGLARLCAGIEADLRAPVDATLICAPKGYKTHYHFDRHSGIVLQIGGRKNWTLFDKVKPYPLTDVPLLPFETAGDGLLRLGKLAIANRREPGLQAMVTLEPGDFLYVPRGVFHEVAADDEASVHVTLAVRAVTYVDLMVAAFARYAVTDAELRRSVASPAAGRDDENVSALLRKLASNFADRIDPQRAIDDLDTAFAAANQPLR
jgi:ribosomal protein L16 Arg81 hydroxylase